MDIVDDGRYRSLYEDAPLPTVTTDADGTLTDVNHAGRQLFGRHASDLIGSPLASLFHDDDWPPLRRLPDHIRGRGDTARATARLAVTGAPRMAVAVAVAGDLAGGGALQWTIHELEDAGGRVALAHAVQELIRCLTRAGDVDDLLVTLCERGAEILPAMFAGVLLIGEDRRLTTVAASQHEVKALEAFQLQNHEGPCFEAVDGRRRVVAEDIGDHAARWPGFVERAQQLGVRSVLGLPLFVGSDALGGLNFLRSTVGPFSDEAVATAEALADLAAFGIASGRALGDSDRVVDQLQHALDSRVVIEQAKGMLAERAGVSVAYAFEGLRRRARDHNRRLRDVCEDFINGDLPLD